MNLQYINCDKYYIVYPICVIPLKYILGNIVDIIYNKDTHKTVILYFSEQ